MKFCTLFALGLWLPAGAQTDLPPNPLITPGKSKARAVGGGVNPGAAIQPSKPAEVRYVTHIVLRPARIWTNTAGKPLEAKLIAFEDLTGKPAADGSDPAVPARPTVVRNGKVRLLVNNKPVEVRLDSLGEEDRELVAKIQVALAKPHTAGE